MVLGYKFSVSVKSGVFVEMYRRKLLALDYPTPDSFTVNDEREFRSVISWLENQKIRYYKVEDRKFLQDLTCSDWPLSYTKYLNDLACPIRSSRSDELEWLLMFAVRLEYGDGLEKYKNLRSENIQRQANAPKVISSNTLDNMDFNSPDFVKGVNTLATALNIAQHPDHLVTLRAVSKFVKARLSHEVLEKPNSVIVKGTPFPFQEADLGFEMGDYVLNHAAKILRLLYIHDLRDLQTQINECIVAVQSVTANPKTDTSLGKVGK